MFLNDQKRIPCLWRTPLLSCYFRFGTAACFDEFATGGHCCHKEVERRPLSLYQPLLNSCSTVSLVLDKVQQTAVQGTVIKTTA